MKVKFNEIITQSKTNEYFDRPEIERFVTVSSRGLGAKERIIGDGKTPVPFSGYRIKKGQLIYSRIGASEGAFAIVPDFLDNAVVSKDFPVFNIDKNKVSVDYLFYYLTSKMFCDIAKSESFGATMTRFKEDKLLKCEIELPTLHEQNKIVNIIKKANSIIIQRQQELQNLDGLVKARFVEMFGDPNDRCALGEKHKIGELCDVTKLAGFEFTEYINYQDSGEIIMLRGLNCKQGQLVLDNVKYIDRETSHKLPRSRLYVGDILMTYAGTIGDVAMVDEDDKYHLAPNVAKISINDKNRVNPTFLVHLFMYSHDYIMTFASQVAQASINMQKIRDFEYIIPCMESQLQFEQFTKQVDKSKVVVQKALDEAQLLFDSLMQKYFG